MPQLSGWRWHYSWACRRTPLLLLPAGDSGHCSLRIALNTPCLCASTSLSTAAQRSMTSYNITLARSLSLSMTDEARQGQTAAKQAPSKAGLASVPASTAATHRGLGRPCALIIVIIRCCCCCCNRCRWAALLPPRWRCLAVAELAHEAQRGLGHKNEPAG